MKSIPKSPNSPKLAQITKILKKILKTRHWLICSFDHRGNHWPSRTLRSASGENCRRESDLKPAKFAIKRIVLVKFVKFEILNPSENRNLKSLTLAHQIWILTQFWRFLLSKFWNLRKIIPKLTKLVMTPNWILNPKIKNLKSLTLKSQKCQNFKFDQKSSKIKISHGEVSILKFDFASISFFRFCQNWFQHGVPYLHTNFKISKSIYTKICKILQNWPKSPKFCRKILLTAFEKNVREASRGGQSSRISPAKKCAATFFTVFGRLFAKLGIFLLWLENRVNVLALGNFANRKQIFFGNNVNMIIIFSFGHSFLKDR